MRTQGRAEPVGPVPLSQRRTIDDGVSAPPIMSHCTFHGQVRSSRFEHASETTVKKNPYNCPGGRRTQIGRTIVSVHPLKTWHFENLEACLICGSTEFHAIYEKSVRNVPLRFVKCSQCGLVF